MPKARELLDYFAKKAAHFSNNRAILTRQKKKIPMQTLVLLKSEDTL